MGNRGFQALFDRLFKDIAKTIIHNDSTPMKGIKSSSNIDIYGEASSLR